MKVADKISNVTDVINNPPPFWDDERRKEYVEWARAVVGKCRVVNQELTDRFFLIAAKENADV